MKPRLCSAFLVGSILFVFFVPQLVGFNNSINEASNEDILRNYTNSYDESPPISINGNQDFGDQANTSEWIGNGTLGNPYILESLNITSSSTITPLLSISHTDVFFEFRHSTLTGGSVGILLTNVTNGLILNNSIQGCSIKGVSASLSDNIQVHNNTINSISSAGQGIYWIQSNNVVLNNNTIRSNCARGMLVDYCSNFMIANNSIQGNEVGIYLRDSDGNTIHRNQVSGDSVGIILGNSWQCNLTENEVFENSNDGIELQDSGNATVISNLVYMNGGLGLEIQAPGTSVMNNTFYKNALSAIRSFIEDDIIVKFNNFFDEHVHLIVDPSSSVIFDYNYWSYWTWPDENNDGISDIPLLVDDNHQVVDPHPMMTPYLDGRIHILSTPTIFLPYESLSRVFDSVNITWGRCGDTFGHSISYSISYTINGHDWIEIISDFVDTTYLWNFTGYPSTINCTIMVQASCSEGLASSGHSNYQYHLDTHLVNIGRIEGHADKAIWGDVLIGWDMGNSNCSAGHEVYFDIYYTLDDGESWILIADGLTGPNHNWDISHLTIGSVVGLMLIARCTEGKTSTYVHNCTYTVNPIALLQDDSVYGPLTVISVIATVVLLFYRFVWKRRRAK